MNTKLDRNYQRLIEEGLSTGSLEIRDNGNEMRNDPRFQVEKGALSVRVEPTFDIIDLSASGMAFQSEFAFKPGTVITLFLEDKMGIQAQVIGCFMVETDSDMMETRYRVQCKFENEEHGRQAMLLMSEVNKLKI